MYITAQTLITAASLIAALTAIVGLVLKTHKWYLRQERQDKEIEKMKKENTLICFALAACLDGLQQLGANHSVPAAKEKLDKYLNQRAHEQE